MDRATDKLLTLFQQDYSSITQGLLKDYSSMMREMTEMREMREMREI